MDTCLYLSMAKNIVLVLAYPYAFFLKKKKEHAHLITYYRLLTRQQNSYSAKNNLFEGL